MEKQPRVLLITDRYLPEVGGTITWFDNAYRRYPPGHVWVVTQDYPGARAFDAEYPGISVTRRKLQRYWFLKPHSLLLYIKLVVSALWIGLRRRIDVIHAGKVLPEGLVARVVSRILRVPYVLYAHGEEITIFGSNPALRDHLPRLYNAAAAVIANSGFTRSQLLDAGCHGRNVVRISPGVDPGVFTPGPRDAELVRKHGLEGKLVLLSVGRLTKRKGHDHVIRALPQILASRPDVVYVITSTGEEADSLRALAEELRVSSAVRFAGEVPLAALPKYYNTADIFILANRTLPGGDLEGFGIVFLEASACSKPVIAGDSGGTGDPVKDGWNGRRIDAREPKNIAQSVLELAANAELRAQMGRNGRSLVESEYAWQRLVERMIDLDRKVSGARGDEHALDLPEPSAPAPRASDSTSRSPERPTGREPAEGAHAVAGELKCQD